MIPKPYYEIRKDNFIIRTFLPNAESDELIWHYDLEDRTVRVIESGGWSFQRDNEIPMPLSDGDTLFIKQGEWHRVISGDKQLIVEIIKEDG